MSKPTLEQLQEAIYGDGVMGSQLSLVVDLVDDAWAEDETERERGRVALEIVNKWHSVHDQDCRYWQTVGECDCGLKEALARVGARRAPSPAASWEDATPSEPEGVEHFNELQRARREAYAAGVCDGPMARKQGIRRCAAHRYPLKKRVPKVISDPHGIGEWKIDGEYLWWRTDSGSDWVQCAPRIEDTKRLSGLAALLNDPWTLEDDHSVEEP